MIPSTPPSLKAYHLLTVRDCARWAEKVISLKRSWIKRDDTLPFFTLGMAAYLDAIDTEAALQNRTAYHTEALRKLNNRLIQEHFSELLETSRAGIERWLSKPTVFAPTLTALPGFHIHLPHATFTSEIASVHNDLQFEQVFPNATPQEGEVLTFTLALSLPEGSGLNIWGDGDVSYHPYHLGHMYLHSGLHRHQAVLFHQMADTPRICLQGHGLILDGKMVLYW